jgi:predicted MFS family arabinose efflux permease
MLYFMPIIVWKALSQAAYSGSFVPLMNAFMKIDHPDWNDNTKLSMSLFAMIPLGFGEIIGALLMGKISDKLGYQTTLKVLLATTVVAFALLFVTIANYTFNPLTFVMTFAWGFQDSSLSNFANCILAFEFDSKVAPFSVFNFSQALFTFAFLVIASKIDD